MNAASFRVPPNIPNRKAQTSITTPWHQTIRPSHLAALAFELAPIERPKIERRDPILAGERR